MSSLKILVSGSVNGKFSNFFDRINKVNKKNGPFDMILVAGSFFSDVQENNQDWIDPIKRLSLGIPQIPIYILGPVSQSQAVFYKNKDEDKPDFEAGFELTEGITFLGKKGVLTGSSGIRIAYLSGKESNESTYITYSEEDAKNLVMLTESSSSVVDVLITFCPPRGFDKYLEFVPNEMKHVSDNGSQLISRLAYHLKPRYHFAAADYFVERRPYRNHRVLQESHRPVTRLFCLASVDNSNKSKWLYAFSISPSGLMEKKELTKQPDGTTERPYDFPNEWSDNRSKSGISKDQFFYSTDYQEERQGNQRRGNKRLQDQQQQQHQRNHGDQQGESGGRNKKQLDDRQQQPHKCWFCLASPDVEKHLIVSIGELCYLALPKGALTPGHCLILPVAHHRSLLESSENQELADEVEKFKKAIGDYFFSQDLVPVFFERNFRSYHFQLQAVPIPKEKLNSIKDKLNRLSEDKGFKLKIIPEEMELKDVLSPGIPYFYMEIPDNNLKLFTQIKRPDKQGDDRDHQQHFPLQFGRELLASSEVLNIPERIDWKNCSLSKEEEIEETKRFREGFKPFDFTLE